jgi:predicted transcriptional regulator
MRGKTPREIKLAIRTLSGSDLTRLRKELNLPKCKPGRPFSKEREKKAKLIRQLWDRGITLNGIAKRYGVTKQCIHQYLHRPNQTARAKVNAALRAGEIIRPKQCSKCKKKCKPEAHHEDYLKPLKIEWLCTVCHSRLTQQKLSKQRKLFTEFLAEQGTQQ